MIILRQAIFAIAFAVISVAIVEPNYVGYELGSGPIKKLG
jgi:hypothetical protein